MDDQPDRPADNAAPAGPQGQKRQTLVTWLRRRGRVMTVSGLVGLLVGLVTWIVPAPVDGVCRLTAHRASWCNDIDGRFLGWWQGYADTYAPPNALPENLPEGNIRVQVLPAREAEIAVAARSTTRAKDDTGLEHGCQQTWRLVAAEPDLLTFEVLTADPVDPDIQSPTRGCPVELTVSMRVAEPGADTAVLRWTFRSGLTPGTLYAKATLTRV